MQLSPSYRSRKKENQCIARGTKLDDISAVLLVWLKQNIDDWDLLVQLRTDKQEQNLLEGIELSLWSDEEKLETCQSPKNSGYIQLDIYSFDVGETPKIEIKYKDFHFISEPKYLIP